MKKITLFLAFFLSVFILAQSDEQKKIYADATSFMKYIESGNFDAILDLTLPALFEKMDRAVVKQSFESLSEENDEFSMQILTNSLDGFEVSEIFKDADTKYAFVTHPTHIKMTFKNREFGDEEKKMMINMMVAQGAKVVFTDKSTIEMTKDSMMIALNDKSTKNQWKYLNYDNTNPLYVSVVPVEIMKKAKEYYADFLIKLKENAN